MFYNKQFITILLVILCGGFASGIAAQPLYIEIVGGQDVGIPIAVLPFEMTKSAKIENIADIIRNDLNTSGHFHAIDASDVEQKPKNISEVNSGYWKNFGTTNIVIGKISYKGSGRYDINVQLIDIYKTEHEPLLNMIFRDKDPAQFRPLAHYISDLIFKKITGVRGFFSTRIAYITVDRYRSETIHTLTVADADGHNEQPVVSAKYPMMSPRWSPDGKKIAFVSFKGRRSSINVVKLINGEVEQVTRFPGINGAPAWSPDGKRLALVLSKDGAPKIYVLDLATKQLQRLTNGASIDTEPFWDPNGDSLLFTSNRGGKPQIYRVILGTGEVQRVTFKGEYNATPSLTPDGKQLVMLHQSEKGAYNIAVQDLNSGRVRLITKSNLDDSPTLAPNGKMVLYGMRETSQNVLGAVSLDGKFRMRLPIQDGNVKEPAWSPFLLPD